MRRVCVCPGAVCHAHSCDLQLMKLGCSRVACQINMSRIPLPPSSVLSYGRLPLSSRRQTTYPLPSQLSRYRFSSLLFFVNLSHTTTDVPSVSLHTLTLSHVAPLPRLFSLSTSGRFDLERNHRTIRAYMFLTALGLLPPLFSARR